MQLGIYAFVPLGILLGIALIAVVIAHWPKARASGSPRGAAARPISPRPSAKILNFPVRPLRIANAQAAAAERAG